jgi:5'-deoxynucleotidase YfbR-like HD superfamily hydrolase
MLREQLEFVRNAGETKRFHTFPVLQTQNIAEHSWHVVMLLYLIFGQQEPGVTPRLLMAGLLHDAAEHKVGDLPAPAKRGMDERIKLEGTKYTNFKHAWDEMEQSILSEVNLDFDKFLTEDEALQLKLCDSLDGMFYCVRERSLGNQRISECYYNFDRYVQGVIDRLKPYNHTDRDVPFPNQLEPNLSPYEVALEVQQYIRDQWETVNGGY